MITALEKHEPRYLDPSGFSTFTRCPAKFYFSRVLGLQQPGLGFASAPDFGTCIHLALPLCYSHDTLQEAQLIFAEAWKGYGYGESDPKRNTARGCAMLENFCRSRADGRAPYEILHFPAVTPPTAKLVSKDELPFLVDVGADLPLAGRIDLAIRWKVDGKVYPCDYKSTSEMSDRLFESFWNCPQALAYTLAMFHLTGEQSPGLMIEAIKVSPKNDEVALFPVTVDTHLLERFLEDFKVLSSSLLACAQSRQWPRNCAMCSSYAAFGVPGFTCPYKNLCSVPDWTTLLTTYQQGKIFHPFEMEE